MSLSLNAFPSYFCFVFSPTLTMPHLQGIFKLAYDLLEKEHLSNHLENLNKSQASHYAWLFYIYFAVSQSMMKEKSYF